MMDVASRYEFSPSATALIEPVPHFRNHTENTRFGSLGHKRFALVNRQDNRIVPPIHSSRNRVIGSTARARRAGIDAARIPTPSMVRTTPPRISGSLGVAW